MTGQMDPAACREHLQGLLTDEGALLTRLEQQLTKEHELLLANDVDGLEAAGDARQGTVAALLRLEEERQSLCRMLGRNPDPAGLSALLQWCDPAGSLAKAHADIASRAAHCRNQNDRNGALVSARLARLNNMLDMLNQGVREARTYSAQATTPAPRNPSGRLFSVQA